MEVQLPDVPGLREGADRVASGFLITGTMLGGVAVEGLERFSKKLQEEWQHPREPNTDLRDLAEALDEAGVDEVDAQNPFRGHPEAVNDDGSLASDTVRTDSMVMAEPAPELEPIILPHNVAEPHVERPAVDTSVSVQNAGREVIKHSFAASRWCACKAISLATKPLQRGISLDSEQVQELDLTQTEQDVTKDLAQNIQADRLPAVNNLATVLVAELLKKQSGRVNPVQIETQFVRILTTTAGISSKKAKLAFRQWGPQRMLRS